MAESIKVIGIVGSRRRNSHEDFVATARMFRAIYNEGDRIVSGGCPKGGDKFAHEIAKLDGIPITIYYPKWSLGRGAGIIRNSLIAAAADVLIACVADDRKGGTEDTIKKFQKLGKTEVILV